LQDVFDKYGDAVLLLRLDVTDCDAAARVVAQAYEKEVRLSVSDSTPLTADALKNIGTREGT